MKSVATVHVLFGGLTSRVSGQPFDAGDVIVERRFVQCRQSLGRFLVEVTYPVDFQKPKHRDRGVR